MRKLVLVRGTGTIGIPLTRLLAELKCIIGIDEVAFHKRSARRGDMPTVKALMSRGASLVVDPETKDDFERLGVMPMYTTDEALNQACIIVECTPSGVGNDAKDTLFPQYEANTAGFIAQGSEFGFGKPYARGINDEALHDEDQYIQIVSCNTHNMATVVNTFGLHDGVDNLVSGRFVCMRRANDISQAGDFVPAPVAGRHKDPRFGTHHARDAWHLFKTLDLDLDLVSSEATLPTQYMHLLHFNLRVKKPVTVAELLQRCCEDKRIAVTVNDMSSVVFSFGRDQGVNGRILNVAVLVEPSLQVFNGTEIIGYCFTPQDGNSLLSSIAAVVWRLYPDDYEQESSA